MRRFLPGILLLILLAASSVQAQTAAVAELSALDLGGFPRARVSLAASSGDDAFLDGLGPTDVTLLEDDQPVEVRQILEEHPGVEMIVAVNPAPAMAIRDSRGTSRYEHIQAALQAWAAAGEGAPNDRYTFLANGIPAASGLDSRASLGSVIANYRPDFKRALPGVESLAAALQIALTPPEAPGTDRFILYITPPPEGVQADALADLRQQAGQSGARLDVWMVSSASLFDSPQAQELAALASAAGGEFHTFSGTEPLPDFNPALEGLGRIYSIEYDSLVRSGKSHTLSAEINRDGEIIRTNSLDFDLAILPPNPMFISPPAAIERTAPADSEKPLEALVPLSYTLQTLVEFPDGRTRALTSARLYVDGNKAVELTQPPFDRFTWDLGGYTSSRTYRLRLEVTDEYGLTSSSIEIPVDISVVIPQVSVWYQIARPKTLASLGAFLLAAVILGFVLFLAGRRRTAGGSRRADRDPLTQPVRPQKDGRGKESSLPRRRGLAPPGAVLVALGENNEPLSRPPAPLTGAEITFGRNPSLANFFLDSPTVDGLHARMKCSGGVYTLSDNGSVAGTWVNYAPVSREGIRLKHGDIIHFGSLTYRFLLSQPGEIRQPSVRAYNGPQ